MKFTVTTREQSWVPDIFRSAKEVDDFRKYHGDEWGGIRDIMIEDDSGQHIEYAWDPYDVGWATQKEREYAQYDEEYHKGNERDFNGYLGGTSPELTQSDHHPPMDRGEWYGTMIGLITVLMIVSFFVPPTIGSLAQFIAVIILFLVIARIILELVGWLFAKLFSTVISVSIVVLAVLWLHGFCGVIFGWVKNNDYNTLNAVSHHGAKTAYDFVPAVKKGVRELRETKWTAPLKESSFP